MLKYFNQMTAWEKIKTIAGALLGVAVFFALSWGMALGCVALGHGPEVCGL